MIKWCLIISLIWHLFCILCFSFSLSINPTLDIYSINFLGSILKDTDFLFSSQSIKTVSIEQFPLNFFLLPNLKKSIKLYNNKDIKKPFLSLDRLLSEPEYASQIYRRIESKLAEPKDVRGLEIDIAPPNWEKIKLEVNK